MKGYKNLVPIVMIVLMIAAPYMMIDTIKETKKEYDGYVEQARKYAKDGIIVDAIENYSLALEVDENIELYLEIGQMFIDNGMIDDADSWKNTILELYPKDVRAYEFSLSVSYAVNAYDECFEIIHDVNARKLKSKKIDKIYEEIRYLYELGFDKYDSVSSFSNGFCTTFSENLWGYAKSNGKSLVKRKYIYAGPFGEGMAPVKDQEGNVYFIDEEANVKKKVPAELNCQLAGIRSESLVTIYDGTVYKYYDYDFNYKFGEYEYASGMSCGVAAIKENGVWYLINNKGKKITKDSYEDVFIDEKGLAVRNDRAFVKVNGKYIMVDTKGKQVGKDSYDDVMNFTNQGMAAVKKGEKWGFVNPSGKLVIEPEYEEARSFIYDFAAVAKDGKWGYINTDNKICIPYTFDNAMDFNSSGCSFVKTDNAWVSLDLYDK